MSTAIPSLAALVTLYRLAPVVWARTSEPRRTLAHFDAADHFIAERWYGQAVRIVWGY